MKWALIVIGLLLAMLIGNMLMLRRINKKAFPENTPHHRD